MGKLSAELEALRIEHGLTQSEIEEAVKLVQKPTRGRGRPPVPEHLRRVQIRGVRIPSWLNGWLKDRGNAGELITGALVNYYKLEEPKNGAL